MTTNPPTAATELAVIPPKEHDRRKYIGGSDIAAVLGVSPWMTPLQLYERKKSVIKGPEAPGSRVMTRGIRWEAVVAEMLVEDLQRKGHEVEIVAANRRYVDESVIGADGAPYLAAEIDFEIRLDGASEVTNVELKTVHPFRMREWGESGSDTLPVHYLAQVMHGLGVTRRTNGYLAALFGADELRTYPVMADAETIAGMRAKAADFWNGNVLQGIAPPPIDLDDLSRLFDRDNPDAQPLLADPELAAKVMRMRAISAEIKAREAEAEALEFDIKRAMRDCTSLVMPNGRTACEWKERSGSYLDETGLKETHPKVYREFVRKWSKRVFSLKTFSTEGI